MLEDRLQNLITEHNLKLKGIFQREGYWIGSVMKLDKILVRDILNLISPQGEAKIKIENKNEDTKFEMLREKQDYIDEVEKAGGIDIDCPLTKDIKIEQENNGGI